MKSIMKLYPLEWLAREAGNDELTACDLEQMDFIEPAWKLVLGNKAILPVLWEMFPGHPNLLPSYYDSQSLSKAEHQNGETWVSKPKFGREGHGLLFSDDFESLDKFIEKTTSQKIEEDGMILGKQIY